MRASFFAATRSRDAGLTLRLERFEQLQGFVRFEVVVHDRVDCGDHCLRSVGLEDITPHVDARRALLDRVVGHGERLDLEKFLATGHDDRGPDRRR